MKRKLIAVALACAMVFSMIPSLAFADVTVELTDDGIPSGKALNDLISEIAESEIANAEDSFDFAGLDLDNYAGIVEKLVAAEEAYTVLDDAASYSGSPGDDTDKDNLKTLAEAQLSKMTGDNVDYMEDGTLRTGYDTALTDLLEEASKDFDPKKIYAGTQTVEVTSLIEALNTLGTPSNYTDDKIKNAELALFAEAVVSHIDRYVSDSDYTTVTSAPRAEDVKAVVAAYPLLTTTGHAAAINTALTGVGNAVSGANIMSMYNAVVSGASGYNSEFVEAFETAMEALALYDGEELTYSDLYIKNIEAARTAYAALIMDKASKDNMSPGLSDLQDMEVAYIGALIDVDEFPTAAISTNPADIATAEKAIEAVKAARAAYDALAGFYADAGETVDLDTEKGEIEAGEDLVKDYYEAIVINAYGKVEAVDDVTAENKADVEAFVKAWEAYEPTLTDEEKEKIEKNTDKTLKAMSDKYAELAPKLADFIQAEEDAAAAEKEAQEQMKADLEQAKADLEEAQANLEQAQADLEQAQKDLKDAETANAAAQAQLKAEAAAAAEAAAKAAQAEMDNAQAKIDILSTKVTGVKVVAGKKKATVSWNKNAVADGYKVYRATSKNGKFKAVKTTAKVKFVNKKLKKGKVYFYKVVAYKKIDGKTYYSKDSKIVKSKKIK